MMRFSLHSDKGEAGFLYESTAVFESSSSPGVRFRVRRMSFARRLELFRRIRDISANLPFLEASSEFRERLEANALSQEIEELYLRWGLAGIERLTIDGEAANLETLIERGPDVLCKEIVAAIKLQCGLSEEERKN